MYPKKIALIDIGTLKVKVQLREYTSSNEMKVLYKTSIRTALGRDWIDNCIQKTPIVNTINALKNVVAEMDKFGQYELQTIGTEALRKADNGQEVLIEIKQQTSIEPELLNQEIEARLFFNAVIHDFKNLPVATLDVGGGSTQIVVGNKENTPDQYFLFPTGTYNIRTAYIDENNPTPEGLLSAKQHIFNALIPLKNISHQSQHLILGSTIALDFFTEILPKLNLPSTTTNYLNHPLMIDVKTIEIILNKLTLLPYSEREKFFSPEPAYTWGVDITLLHVLAVCEYLNLSTIIPTNHNLSSGLFLKSLE